MRMQVRLCQPTPLQSAYPLDSPPTHVVTRYANTLEPSPAVSPHLPPSRLISRRLAACMQVPRYANTLDWICVEGERLQVVGVAPRPPLQVS